MGVALEGALGVTVLGLVTGEVPDDQSLVTGSGQEHVGAVEMLAIAVLRDSWPPPPPPPLCKGSHVVAHFEESHPSRKSTSAAAVAGEG